MKYLLTILMTVMFALSIQAKEITLSSDNTLTLSEPFTSNSVTKLMQKATDMDANLKSGYPIYLFLYTPGGSIQAGLELIEFLNGINRPVHTITLFSASMGFQLVQHMGKRYILKYGVLMSHKARGSFSGEFGGGISQLDSRYQLWLRRIGLMDKQTVDRTKGKQTMKSYTDAYTPELWLNGAEAVEKGYADKVAIVKCDLSMQEVDTITLNFGFWSIVAEFSKCPLKTAPLSIKANIITNKGEMPLRTFLENDGKFGESCSDEDSVYWTQEDTELCAKDKNLTLEQIRNKIKEKNEHFTRNLRDHIIYSY